MFILDDNAPIPTSWGRHWKVMKVKWCKSYAMAFTVGITEHTWISIGEFILAISLSHINILKWLLVTYSTFTIIFWTSCRDSLFCYHGWRDRVYCLFHAFMFCVLVWKEFVIPSCQMWLWALFTAEPSSSHVSFWHGILLYACACLSLSVVVTFFMGALLV